MPTTLAALATRRDTWLANTVHTLQTEARFLAAWLAGSFGRGMEDAVSDLDLHVTLADDASPLLRKPVAVQAGATPERMALFERFGTPVIVHENHWNAICDGTFSYVRYADLVKVDWQLIAPSKTQRPHFSQLLFAHRDIPHAAAPAPEPMEARRAALMERPVYFWLMLDSACTMLLRGDLPALTAHMLTVHAVLDDIERLMRGAPVIWRAQHLAPFVLCDMNTGAWVKKLRWYADQMAARHPAIEAVVGEPIQPAPLQQIKVLLALATW